MLFKIFSGNCAILYRNEDIYRIDHERIEGFVTVAMSPRDAIAQVREQFNADALENEEARLEVIITTEEELTENPVYLVEFLGWPDDGEEDDQELSSI